MSYEQRGYSTVNNELNKIIQNALSQIYNDLILEQNPYFLLTNNDKFTTSLVKEDADNKTFLLKSQGGYYISFNGNLMPSMTNTSNTALTGDPTLASDIWFVYNQESKSWFINVTIKNIPNKQDGTYVLIADKNPTTNMNSESTEIILLQLYSINEDGLSTEEQRFSVYKPNDKNYRGLFKITKSLYHSKKTPSIEIRNVFHNPSYSWLIIDSNPPNYYNQTNEIVSPRIYIHKQPLYPVSFTKRTLFGKVNSAINENSEPPILGIELDWSIGNLYKSSSYVNQIEDDVRLPFLGISISISNEFILVGSQLSGMSVGDNNGRLFLFEDNITSPILEIPGTYIPNKQNPFNQDDLSQYGRQTSLIYNNSNYTEPYMIATGTAVNSIKIQVLLYSDYSLQWQRPYYYEFTFFGEANEKLGTTISSYTNNHGHRLITGAPGKDNDTGTIHVYDITLNASNDSNSENDFLCNDIPINFVDTNGNSLSLPSGKRFGSVVTMSHDGTLIAIASENEDKVRLFSVIGEIGQNNITLQLHSVIVPPSNYTEFGSDIALNKNGITIAIQTKNVNEDYVILIYNWDFVTSSWIQMTQEISSYYNSQFTIKGRYVKLSQNGNTLITSNKVYQRENRTVDTWTEVRDYVDTSQIISIDLSEDMSTIVASNSINYIYKTINEG